PDRRGLRFVCEPARRRPESRDHDVSPRSAITPVVQQSGALVTGVLDWVRSRHRLFQVAVCTRQSRLRKRLPKNKRVTAWKLVTLRFTAEFLGWLMGLEPTTTGITILDSTN